MSQLSKAVCIELKFPEGFSEFWIFTESTPVDAAGPYRDADDAFDRARGNFQMLEVEEIVSSMWLNSDEAHLKDGEVDEEPQTVSDVIWSDSAAGIYVFRERIVAKNGQPWLGRAHDVFLVLQLGSAGSCSVLKFFSDGKLAKNYASDFVQKLNAELAKRQAEVGNDLTRPEPK